MNDAINISGGYIPYAAHEADLGGMAEELAREVTVHYDTLVGIGLSGALVVPILGRVLDKHWLLLRKPSDNAHTSAVGEGRLGQYWLFVDDFISSGATYARVHDLVDQAVPPSFKTKFVGAYQYSYGSFQEAGLHFDGYRSVYGKRDSAPPPRPNYDPPFGGRPREIIKPDLAAIEAGLLTHLRTYG